jgi:hypothetical protein
MDIALLSANANQLRHAVELSPPFRYNFVYGKLSLSETDLEDLSYVQSNYV